MALAVRRHETGDAGSHTATDLTRLLDLIQCRPGLRRAADRQPDANDQHRYRRPDRHGNPLSSAVTTQPYAIIVQYPSMAALLPATRRASNAPPSHPASVSGTVRR